MMKRVFQFLSCAVAVDGLPSSIQDGEYLSAFRSGALPDITLSVEVLPLPLPYNVGELGADRRVVLKGKNYLAATFNGPEQVVWFPPGDWKGEHITAYAAPCVLSHPKFTANQLLAVTGFSSALLYRNCLTLHCSYIVCQGRAILFAAPSGTGKSTQAALWEKYRGAEIVNGDRALLFQRDGRWLAGGISVCGSSNICKNKTAPLLAVVLLEQGPENRVLPCTAGEKFRALLGGSAYHRWSKEELELVSALCLQAAEDVPVLRLRCRPDGDAVDTLERALEGFYEL